MAGKEVIRRVAETDPQTGQPRRLETRVCEGQAHHRFQYTEGQTPTRCPVAGCESKASLREQRLRD